MGLANQAYVSRDWNTAIQLCRGIITKQPWSPEPYTTLAMVYKEMGDEKMVVLFLRCYADAQAFRYRLIESTCLPDADVDWFVCVDAYMLMLPGCLSPKAFRVWEIQNKLFTSTQRRSESTPPIMSATESSCSPHQQMALFERSNINQTLGSYKSAMDGFAQLIAIAPEPRVQCVWLGWSMIV
jgi:hypothetical protein